MNKPLKVLAIDGGGTRGLFPATILHQLEQDTGKKVTDIFDVIVGSATGGIIAVALSSGMEITDIVDIYLKQAGYILPANRWRRIWNPVNLFTSKYPADNLKQLLEEKVGADKRLKDVREKFGTDTVFLYGTLDMSPDLAPGETPSFKVVMYNSSMAEFENEKLVDIAMRTSAAVVNLPLYEHYSESGNYANDPTMIALSFCMNRQTASGPGVSYLEGGKMGMAAASDEIKFLSLGCGSDGKSFVPRDKIGRGKWGLLKWFGHLTSLVIETNMVANQYYMRQFLDDEHYMRLSAYYKADDAPSILKDKKLAIDVTDQEQLDAIKSYAESIFEAKKGELKDFLEL